MSFNVKLALRFKGHPQPTGLMKGTRPKPIGKTGYYTRRVPPAAGYNGRGRGAPATYRVINPEGKEINSFLTRSAAINWVRYVM